MSIFLFGQKLRISKKPCSTKRVQKTLLIGITTYESFPGIPTTDKILKEICKKIAHCLQETETKSKLKSPGMWSKHFYITLRYKESTSMKEYEPMSY